MEILFVSHMTLDVLKAYILGMDVVLRGAPPSQEAWDRLVEIANADHPERTVTFPYSPSTMPYIPPNKTYFISSNGLCGQADRKDI